MSEDPECVVAAFGGGLGERFVLEVVEQGKCHVR